MFETIGICDMNTKEHAKRYSGNIYYVFLSAGPRMAATRLGSIVFPSGRFMSINVVPIDVEQVSAPTFDSGPKS